MKKILFILVLVVLSSCSSDNYYDTRNRFTGHVSIQPFSVYFPEFYTYDDCIYFKLPRYIPFEGNIEGFTKVDHNVFIADTDKEYNLSVKVHGEVKHQTDNAHVSFGYYLAIKHGLNIAYLESSMFKPKNYTKRIKVKQGDTLSFNIAARGYLEVVTQLDNYLLEINIKERIYMFD